MYQILSQVTRELRSALARWFKIPFGIRLYLTTQNMLNIPKIGDEDYKLI